MNKENISEIVKKAKAGDSDAFAKLFELTQEKAYYTALKITKNSNDAQDMLQDAFVKAFTSLDTLKDDSKFQSWFNCIVANNCRNYIIRKKPNLFSEYNNDESDIDFENTLENDNEALLPHEVTDSNETKRLIMQCINKLPDDQKLCVIMFYYDEMSVKEIAQALDISEGTVKSRLSLARKKLKAEFEKLEDEGTKLYGIPFFPLIRWVFKADSAENKVSKATNKYFKKSILETLGEESLLSTPSKLPLMSAIGSKAVAIISSVFITAALVTGGVLAYNHFINNRADSVPAFETTTKPIIEKEDSDSYYFNGEFAVCDENKENIYYISNDGVCKDENKIFDSPPYNLVYTDRLYFVANGSLYSYSANELNQLFDVNSCYIYQSHYNLIGINKSRNTAYMIDTINKTENKIKISGSDISFNDNYLYFRDMSQNVCRTSVDNPNTIETVVAYNDNHNMKLPYFVDNDTVYYSDFDSDKTGNIFQSNIGDSNASSIHIGNNLTDFSITDNFICYCDYNGTLCRYDKQTETSTQIAKGDFGYSCSTDVYQLWYETNDNKTYLIKQDDDSFYRVLNGCIPSAQILDNQIYYQYNNHLYHLNLTEIEGVKNG